MCRIDQRADAGFDYRSVTAVRINLSIHFFRFMSSIFSRLQWLFPSNRGTIPGSDAAARHSFVD